MQDFDYINASNIEEVIRLLSNTDKRTKKLNGRTELNSQKSDKRFITH